MLRITRTDIKSFVFAVIILPAERLASKERWNIWWPAESCRCSRCSNETERPIMLYYQKIRMYTYLHTPCFAHIPWFMAHNKHGKCYTLMTVYCWVGGEKGRGKFIFSIFCMSVTDKPTDSLSVGLFSLTVVLSHNFICEHCNRRYIHFIQHITLTTIANDVVNWLVESGEEGKQCWITFMW